MLDSVHLHPALVHFPVAAIIIGFVFEAISLYTKNEAFKKPGFYLLVIGALGTVIAWRTGDADAESYKTVSTFLAAIDAHEMWGQISMVLSLVAAALLTVVFYFKKNLNILRWAAFVVWAVCVFSLFKTGYTGGELVYKHAIGVTAPKNAAELK